MPRATRPTAQKVTPSEKAKPYSTATKTEGSTKEKATDKKTGKARTGKDSHLYTDDNPSTTLHGTGFKDAATANHTIKLVSQRSLLYQFQTINTMYHRAAHHPSSKSNLNIQAAMKIFRKWLDETYPAAKDAQRDYPLLKKEVVEKYLTTIENELESSEYEWAKLYIALPKGKRLANTLVDNSKPGERDLAIVRQNFLDAIVDEEFGGEVPPKDDGRLWEEKVPSQLHLKMIAHGFSPVKADVLSKLATA